jgi:Armadillo/beta-catenin-like repeat
MNKLNRPAVRNQLFQSQPSRELIQLFRDERNIQLRKQKRIEHAKTRRNMTENTNMHSNIDINWLPSELIGYNPDLVSNAISVQEKFEILMNLAVNPSISISIPATNAAFIYLQKTSLSSELGSLTKSICEGLIKNLGSPSEVLQLSTLKIISQIFFNESPGLVYFKELNLMSLITRYTSHSCKEIVNESLCVMYNYLLEFPNEPLGDVLRVVSSVLHSPELATTQNYSWISWILKLISSSKALKTAHAIEMHKFLQKLLPLPEHEILIPALEALSVITYNFNETIDKTLDHISELFVFLNSNNTQISINAIRIIGNIINGTDAQTQTLINLGVIDKLLRCIEHPNSEMVKESVFCIGNILAGPEDQIAAVLNNPKVSFKKIMFSVDNRVKEEGLWWIRNVIQSQSKPMIIKLMQKKVITNLFIMLDECEASTQRKVLDILYHILKYLKDEINAEDWDNLITQINNENGISRIESLDRNKKHDNEISKIYKILDIDNVQEISLTKPVKFEFS